MDTDHPKFHDEIVTPDELETIAQARRILHQIGERCAKLHYDPRVEEAGILDSIPSPFYLGRCAYAATAAEESLFDVTKTLHHYGNVPMKYGVLHIHSTAQDPEEVLVP